ncbi:MAG TPA: hypothetical protein VHV74_22920 [Pseudonocardiaceae bacterium]|jgi:hypothetical protein|nr:hypothetical protein [Pseudonocardiaceae bacterium]
MTRHTPMPGAAGTTFLPLAVAAATTAVAMPADPPVQARAQVVRRHAEAADVAAADCWTALLAGCQAPARRVLPAKLHELTEATSLYLGTRSWYGQGSPHRGRVTDAEARITDAVRDGDGAEFAEACAGYDQAVATALASVRTRTVSPA